MKTKSNFTMIELVVLIGTVFILLFIATLIRFDATLRNSQFPPCQGNLGVLGKEFICYSLDKGFFPCSVMPTDDQQIIDRKLSNKERSTLDIYNTYRESDNNDIDPKRFFCPESSCHVPMSRNSVLKSSNVSYHYINSNVSSKILKGNRGLIRDLNEGHEDAKFGNVLMANGSVQKIEKIGKKTSDLNYKVNWYRNKKTFENYQEFDNFMNDVSDKKRDEVD